MRQTARWIVLATSLLNVTAALAQEGAAGAADPHPVWLWPLLLFLFCLALGVVAVIAGVGGGILYVPLVSALFPFHLDFIRGAGLLIALAGALSSAPKLLRRNLASLRLAAPSALFISTGAVLGSLAGLRLPRALIQVLLGCTVIGIAILMIRSAAQDVPLESDQPDPLGTALRIGGTYLENSTDTLIHWRARNVKLGFVLAFGTGILGGLFGVGAGWANVPNFNLVMGVPLKVAAASSVFLMSIGSASAAWIYITHGSVLPIMVVPSVIGLILGSRVGATLLDRAQPAVVKRVVVAVLLLAGVRSLWRGISLWLGGV